VHTGFVPSGAPAAGEGRRPTVLASAASQAVPSAPGQVLPPNDSPGLETRSTESTRYALAHLFNKGSLSAGPPSAGSFSCPSGQKLVLADVAYTGITLTDTTNNVTASLADITRVFFTF